jgi:peptidoglycan/LPS O-acetylase OafA/YrhL
MSNAKHDNSFDALRILAALLVVYGHAVSLTGDTGLTFAGAGVATTGVKIFFAISGYLIALSWRRAPHPADYLRRRLLRIVPGLAIAVLLIVFVLGPVMTNLPLAAYFGDARTWTYLANIVFYPAPELPGVFTENIARGEVNRCLWSLPPEMSMYLILPVAAYASFRLTQNYRVFAMATIAFTVTAFLVVRPMPGIAHWFVYGTRVWAWLAVAPFFLIGACFALCNWERLFHRGVAVALLAGLALMQGPPLLQEMLLAAALPYIVLTFGVRPSPFLRGLTRRGDLSYGIYLYAFPIQQILIAKFGTPGGGLGNFVAATIIAAGFAYLSWRFIEAPALRAKPKAQSGAAAPEVALPLPVGRCA